MYRKKEGRKEGRKKERKKPYICHRNEFKMDHRPKYKMEKYKNSNREHRKSRWPWVW